MQRIQAVGVLTMKTRKTIVIFLATGAMLLGAGCGQHKARSVADYIHDVDAANAVMKDAKLHPEKTGDQDVINASTAAAQTLVASVAECWPTKPISSATTDHECLDRKGYKR